MSKPYIKNQKEHGGSKYLCAQDEEDFEQEKLIQEWLKREGRVDEIGYEHINRKGNARNTLVRAQVRLDQEIIQDEPGTFADLIAGSDGRDLECAGGGGQDPFRSETAPHRLDSELNLFCDAIGASEETKKWVKKSLKSESSLQNLRSLMKEEEQLEISPINSESLRPFLSFRK